MVILGASQAVYRGDSGNKTLPPVNKLGICWISHPRSHGLVALGPLHRPREAGGEGAQRPSQGLRKVFTLQVLVWHKEEAQELGRNNVLIKSSVGCKAQRRDR